MIPELDQHGLLPPGIWPCTFAEAQARFATTSHRRQLWEGLRRFMANHVPKVPGVVAIYIDGSYTSSKALPADIDVVADLVGLEDTEALLESLRAKLRRAEFKQTYGVDFWVRHPDLPIDLAATFQQVGDKQAARLGLHPTHPKGILKVRP